MDYKTTKEAAKYVYDTLKKVDPEGEILEVEKIEELIKDDIIDRLEIEMDPEDIAILEKNRDEEDFFDAYITEKYGEYEDMLTDTVNDMISGYILEEEGE